MSVPAHRLFVLLLLVVSWALAGGGCCSQVHTCTMSRGLWESPIIRETRALLVVPDEELSILRVDGKDPQASRLSRGPAKEYFLPGGDHCVTASFWYAAPMRGGPIGSVHGLPLTLKRRFVVGHKYVAAYRQYLVAPGPAPRWLLDALVAEIVPPQREYWSLDIVDVTETAKGAGK
jgi:hypothetical protein